MSNGVERMNMGEIRDWITYRIELQSRNWVVPAQDPAVFRDNARVRMPHSDLNAAREIYSCFAHLIHYVPGLGAWHIWNEVFHEKIDGDLLAHWICTSFVDAHKARLSDVKDHYVASAAAIGGMGGEQEMGMYTKVDFKEHREYRDRIHMSGGIAGLVSQIKQIFSVEETFFTDDRRWLVLQNGVLDLEDLRRRPVKPGDLEGLAGRLLDRDPARPVWRAVDASLRPSVRSEAFERFLRTSQPDGELRKFLAVVTGAAFLAESKTKIIPVLKGPRDSGKTIYIDTIHKLAGGYGGQPDTAAINKTNGPNFEQDQFRGLRFVGISEPNTDRKVDDSFLKKFTGGDVLSTRNLHARSVPWKSQGIIFVATNSELKFNTNDRAILSRFATVKFPHQFYPQGQVPVGKDEFIQDPYLERRLELEMDGVLGWVLNGLLCYLDEGVVIPASVERERERQFVEGSSVVSWFLNLAEGGTGANFILMGSDDPSALSRPRTHYVAVADAHLAYTSWVVQEMGDEPLGRRKFSEAAQEYLGVELVKSGAWRLPRLVYEDMVKSVDV